MIQRRPSSIATCGGQANPFKELLFSALMLARNFDLQIDGAPPELREEWCSQLVVTEACLADTRRAFGMTT